MAAITTPLQRAKVKLRVIARLQLAANARAAARAAASGAAAADTIDEEETYDGSYNNGINHRRNPSQASTAAGVLCPFCWYVAVATGRRPAHGVSEMYL